MKLSFNTPICQGVPGTTTANCCFPSIARGAGGQLIATWRMGSQKDSADGAIWLASSRDDGRSWSSPTEVFQPGSWNGGLREPHYAPISVLSDGRMLAAVMWVGRRESSLPFFNPVTEGILPLQTVFYSSSDSGLSWSDMGELDTAPYSGPLAITGPLLELPDGELACQFEVNKNYDDTEPWRHAAALKISPDGGRTWPECREVANDASGQLFFWDARIVKIDSRQCLAMFWTFDRVNRRDRRVHIAHSDDAGRTWTKPLETPVVGQVAEPVPFRNHRLALIVVDRYESRSIKAFLSDDCGKTFGDELLVYRQPGGQMDAGRNAVTADYLQDMELWTFGRVQAVTDAKNSIWVVYYAGDANSTGIYCAKIEL